VNTAQDSCARAIVALVTHNPVAAKKLRRVAMIYLPKMKQALLSVA
jgi:hypothetical protein